MSRRATGQFDDRHSILVVHDDARWYRAQLVGQHPRSVEIPGPFEKPVRNAGHFSFDDNRVRARPVLGADFSEIFSIHPAPGSTEAFRGRGRFQFTETSRWPRDPDGPFLTSAAHGNFREIHAEFLDPEEPTVYEFTAIDAGRFRDA